MAGRPRWYRIVGLLLFLGALAAWWTVLPTATGYLVAAIVVAVAGLLLLLLPRRVAEPGPPPLTGFAGVAQRRGWSYQEAGALDELMGVGAWFLPTRVLVPSEHWNLRPRGRVEHVLRGDLDGRGFVSMRLLLADPVDVRREQPFGIVVLDATGPLGVPHGRPSRLTIRLAPGGSPPGKWGKVAGEHTLWAWTDRRLVFWTHEEATVDTIEARLAHLAALSA